MICNLTNNSHLSLTQARKSLELFLLMLNFSSSDNYVAQARAPVTQARICQPCENALESYFSFYKPSRLSDKDLGQAKLVLF